MEQYESRIYLNNNWQFVDEFQPEMIESGYENEQADMVRLPHANTLMPRNYAKESDCEKVTGYRTTFELGQAYIGKTILLTFEGAAHEATVYVNGTVATVHRSGYTSFTVDITGLVVYDRANIVAVRLDSRTQLNQPPFTKNHENLAFGGIYGEVYLDIKNPIYIEDIYVYPGKKEEYIRRRQTQYEAEHPDKDKKKALIQIPEISTDVFTYEITFADKVGILGQKGYYAELGIYDLEGNLVRELPQLDISKEVRFGNKTKEQEVLQTLRNKLTGKEFAGVVGEVGRHVITCVQPVDDLLFWDMYNPQKYEIRATLRRHIVKNVTDFSKNAIVKEQEEEMFFDDYATTFGLRIVEFRKDGFYLNGKKQVIRGIEQKEAFPYVGLAMPTSMQDFEAGIIQEELGMNTVCLKNFCTSQDFLEACDRRGIFVVVDFTKNIADTTESEEEQEIWKKIFCQDVEECIFANRKHPSVVLWNTDTEKDEALSQMSESIVHTLDVTRGARAQFVFYGRQAHPTKMTDSAARQLEFAQFHGKQLQQLYENEQVAGGFVQFMTDTQTRTGSGMQDGVRYDGLMDGFRNPKLAAAVYACMGKAPVLEVASSMNTGDFDGGYWKDIYVWSNADSVRVYKNDIFLKEYPVERHTTGKKGMQTQDMYYPICVNDLIGERLEKEEGFSRGKSEDVKKLLMAMAKEGQITSIDLKMRATKLSTLHHIKEQELNALYQKYIVDEVPATYRFEAIQAGEIVKTVTKEPIKEVHLEAESKQLQLHEHTTYDVAAIRITAKDQNGNLCADYHEPVILEAQGGIGLIGPNIITLQGGCGGTYVATTGEDDAGTLVVSGMRGDKITIAFSITR